jgi:hypothetical protein
MMKKLLIIIALATLSTAAQGIGGHAGFAGRGGFGGGASGGPAWSLVQAPLAVTVFSGTTCAVSFSANVTAGNLVFVGVANIATTSTLSVADNHSDSFTAVNSVFTGGTSGNTAGTWSFVPASTQSETVTFTAGTAFTGGVCFVAEWNKAAGSPVIDSGTPNTSDAFQGTSASLATAGNLSTNADLLIGVVFASSSTLSAGSGFTAAPNVTTTRSLLEYKVLTSGSGSPGTALFSQAASNTLTLLTAAFK